MSLFTTIICLCIAFILGWKTSSFVFDIGMREAMRRRVLFRKLDNGKWLPYDPTTMLDPASLMSYEDFMRILNEIKKEVEDEKSRENRS
jgi:hypothetical protein